jgi:hypothetical protein
MEYRNNSRRPPTSPPKIKKPKRERIRKEAPYLPKPPPSKKKPKGKKRKTVTEKVTKVLNTMRQRKRSTY